MDRFIIFLSLLSGIVIPILRFLPLIMEDNVTTYSNAVSVWNFKLSKTLIPNNIVLSFYIFWGIIGNTTVIIVYRFRMRTKSEDRYFIPILAVSDLAGATVCGSFGIALNMMQTEFDNTRLIYARPGGFLQLLRNICLFYCYLLSQHKDILKYVDLKAIK